MEGTHTFGLPPRGLTPWQREILALVRDDCSNKEIGRRLFLKEQSVKNHLIDIFDRLNVSTRTGAVIQAIRLGYLELGESIEEPPEKPEESKS